MNLKIEPSDHQYPSNGTSNGCSTSGNSGHMNNNQTVKLSESIHHQQAPSSNVDESRNMPPHHTTNMTTIHTLTPVSGQEYNPSTPIPISQSNHSSSSMSSYAGVILQPGTPDDDDYQHNYQDISSTNRHLLSTVTTPHLHTQTSTGFTQLQPHSAIKTSNNETCLMDTNLSNSARLNDANSHLGSHTTFSSDLINGGQPSSTSLGLGGGCPQMHFSHVNSTLIDSCASPFQSPASTPYPQQMGTYISSDIPDYYSTSDCMRYTS